MFEEIRRRNSRVQKKNRFNFQQSIQLKIHLKISFFLPIWTFYIHTKKAISIYGKEFIECMLFIYYSFFSRFLFAKITHCWCAYIFNNTKRQIIKICHTQKKKTFTKHSACWPKNSQEKKLCLNVKFT